MYAVTLHTRWSAANSAGLRAQAVGLNGAAVPEMINSLVQSALQPNGAMTYSYEIILPNATDYITCYCRQTVGNEYSLDPFTKVVVARVR